MQIQRSRLPQRYCGAAAVSRSYACHQNTRERMTISNTLYFLRAHDFSFDSAARCGLVQTSLTSHLVARSGKPLRHTRGRDFLPVISNSTCRQCSIKTKYNSTYDRSNTLLLLYINLEHSHRPSGTSPDACIKFISFGPAIGLPVRSTFPLLHLFDKGYSISESDHCCIQDLFARVC